MTRELGPSVPTRLLLRLAMRPGLGAHREVLHGRCPDSTQLCLPGSVARSALRAPGSGAATGRRRHTAHPRAPGRALRPPSPPSLQGARGRAGGAGLGLAHGLPGAAPRAQFSGRGRLACRSGPFGTGDACPWAQPPPTFPPPPPPTSPEKWARAAGHGCGKRAAGVGRAGPGWMKRMADSRLSGGGGCRAGTARVRHRPWARSWAGGGAVPCGGGGGMNLSMKRSAPIRSADTACCAHAERARGPGGRRRSRPSARITGVEAVARAGEEQARPCGGCWRAVSART